MIVAKIIVSIMMLILTIIFAWNAPKEEDGASAIIIFSFALATALSIVFMWV